MSLHETEEIIGLKQTICVDLFERVSIRLTHRLWEIDRTHILTSPMFAKNELNMLLANIYLYFLHPISQNRYQNLAYDFFNRRLRYVKELNPLKNVYDYGKAVLNDFLVFVDELELFFRNMMDFYLDYLDEIKSLKRIDFNSKVVFKSIIVDFLHPDQRYLVI